MEQEVYKQAIPTSFGLGNGTGSPPNKQFQPPLDLATEQEVHKQAIPTPLDLATEQEVHKQVIPTSFGLGNGTGSPQTSNSNLLWTWQRNRKSTNKQFQPPITNKQFEPPLDLATEQESTNKKFQPPLDLAMEQEVHKPNSRNKCAFPNSNYGNYLQHNK